MWAFIWNFVATRAATGWAIAGGLAVAISMWAMYDARGDKIAELKLDLARCHGSSEQQRIIDSLAAEVQGRAKEKADANTQDIRNLPNDCYFLDDPSPLRLPEQGRD